MFFPESRNTKHFPFIKAKGMEIMSVKSIQNLNFDWMQTYWEVQLVRLPFEYLCDLIWGHGHWNGSDRLNRCYEEFGRLVFTMDCLTARWTLTITHRCMILHGIAQWLKRRIHDCKVAGSNPCWSGRKIFFSRVDFLCWLLFRYPFHPCVTAVARKRSRSFCQKCRWQVTAKHTYTLCMWLCIKWHGAWLYGVHRTCAKTTAVSCGTSRANAVSTPLQWMIFF